MKKHLEYKIASALAVSALAIPSAIYAQPVMDVVYPGPEVVINTPEDFINTFCSVKALNEFNEEINVLILEVNPENYGLILAGKGFYDDYCINNPDMANAINTTLIESPAMRSYEDYFNQAVAVQTALEQEAALQAELEQAALQAEMEQAALMEMPEQIAPVEEIAPELPMDAALQALEVEPEAVIVPQEEAVIMQTSVYPAAEVQETARVVEVTSVSESPLLTMLAQAEPALTEPVEEIAAPVNEIAPEAETLTQVQPEVEEAVPVSIVELTEPASEAQPVSDTEPAVLEKMETASDSSQDVSAAQSFVDRYLKDDMGNVYAAATPSNYTRIIGSLKEWNNLPVSVQNEINSILVSATGVSYQALLQQAQQIASGSINRVNTGAKTQSFLFGFTALFSALGAGLFYDKQRGR